jgi:Transposase
MTLPQHHIGVDVSKNWIDTFTASSQQFTRIANQGLSLAEWAAGLGDVTVIFEATGRYDHDLRARLDEVGIPYVRMNPLRARQFARAAGFLAKTDRLDARILCMMGEALRPEPTMPMQPVRQRLYDLQARREDIVAMIIAEQGRLSTANDGVDAPSSNGIAMCQVGDVKVTHDGESIHEESYHHRRRPGKACVSGSRGGHGRLSRVPQEAFAPAVSAVYG